MLTKLQAKYIQSLSQKKVRDEEGVFVAEGPKVVAELLQAPNIRPVAVYGVEDWQLPSSSIEKITIKPSELERISFLTTPNQVLGIFQKPIFIPDTAPLILMLDGIRDPGNLGTIVRTADWFGIPQIVCSNDTADVFNPKVVQSTMGSISRVEVVYTDLPAFIQQQSRPVFATTLHGKPLQEIKHLKEGIIVTGNESTGIRKEVLDLATHHITIERKGEAESLNAAVATGIVLSAIVN